MYMYMYMYVGLHVLYFTTLRKSTLSVCCYIQDVTHRVLRLRAGVTRPASPRLASHRAAGPLRPRLAPCPPTHVTSLTAPTAWRGGSRIEGTRSGAEVVGWSSGCNRTAVNVARPQKGGRYY